MESGQLSAFSPRIVIQKAWNHNKISFASPQWLDSPAGKQITDHTSCRTNGRGVSRTDPSEPHHVISDSMQNSKYSDLIVRNPRKFVADSGSRKKGRVVDVGDIANPSGTDFGSVTAMHCCPTYFSGCAVTAYFPLSSACAGPQRIACRLLLSLKPLSFYLMASPLGRLSYWTWLLPGAGIGSRLGHSLIPPVSTRDPD